MSCDKYARLVDNIRKIQHDNFVKKYNFFTENSRDVSTRLIKIAQKTIKRTETIIMFSNILFNIKQAIKLERGIFEFSLIHVSMNSLEDKFVSSVYYDKVHDIKINIDGNTKINNTTLKPSILNNSIPPEYVAFLSPEQMHPMQWKDLLEKRQIREDREKNIATTDLYRCKKCGERKAKITQMQTRSADEPMTLFICCLVCYNTMCI